MSAVLPEVLAKKYRLERVLGRGGMGIVYQAIHRNLKSRVAIKVLNPCFSEQDRFIKRFLQEAVAASRLRSRYAVRIYDSDVTPDGEPYIVMEYLIGRELSVRLSEGLPSQEQVVDWMIQLCSAMYEAHLRNVIHCDIKPANIFIEEPGDTIKLLDFGVARLVDDGEITAATEIVGTPLFMAPEQWQGAKPTPRSDLWSMGIVAYKSLSGRYPYPDHSAGAGVAALYNALHGKQIPLGEANPNLPAGLVNAVMRAIAKDPDERFEDAREFAKALEPYGSGQLTFEAPSLDPTPPVESSRGQFLSEVDALPAKNGDIRSSFSKVSTTVPAPVDGLASVPILWAPLEEASSQDGQEDGPSILDSKELPAPRWQRFRRRIQEQPLAYGAGLACVGLLAALTLGTFGSKTVVRSLDAASPSPLNVPLTGPMTSFGKMEAEPPPSLPPLNAGGSNLDPRSGLSEGTPLESDPSTYRGPTREGLMPMDPSADTAPVRAAFGRKGSPLGGKRQPLFLE